MTNEEFQDWFSAYLTMRGRELVLISRWAKVCAHFRDGMRSFWPDMPPAFVDFVQGHFDDFTSIHEQMTETVHDLRVHEERLIGN